MNAPVRPLSPRPNIITDTWGFWLLDPATGTVVGRNRLVSTGRVVSALRLGEVGNSQWHHLRRPTTIVDTWGFYLMDPATQTIVGREGVSVQRCLTARWTEGRQIGSERGPLPPPPRVPDVPINQIVFNFSDVYTPSAGMVSCIVECFGGGGGGASVPADFRGGGGGGGSGGYTRVFLTRAQVGSSQAVTIANGGAADAAGGTTSFGNLCIAYGGQPGLPPHDYAMEGGFGAPQWTLGFARPGNAGMHGYVAFFGEDTNTNPPIYPMPVGGMGGAILGGSTGGDQDAGYGFGVAGEPALPNTGAGGNGAVNNFSLSAYPGGAGGSGVCIVTEYS